MLARVGGRRFLQHVFAFRHGQSTFNEARVKQGRVNTSKLTERGRLQARAIGERLKDEKISYIVTSPLRRTMETADIVNARLRVPIRVDGRLTEADPGLVQGWLKAHIKDAFPNANVPDWVPRWPGAETRVEVRNRVWSLVREILREGAPADVAISGHGGVVAAVCNFFNPESFKLANGALVRIDVETGDVSVECDGSVEEQQPK